MWVIAFEIACDLALVISMATCDPPRTPPPADPNGPLLFRELPPAWKVVATVFLVATVVALVWVAACL